MSEADLVVDPPTAEDVVQASERIAEWVRHTPVITSTSLDDEVGASLFFKCENLQRSGAFKFRGASNAILSKIEAGDAGPVATHSSGNHGAALAMAAARAGLEAHVVVPSNANPTKLAAVRAAGARVVICEPTMSSRLSTLAKVVEETGAEPISPFDDARIIAGQGTAALELLSEVRDLDLILVPVGGAGLLAGTLLAAQVTATGQQAPVVVWGAEPELADAASRSLASGHREAQDSSTTMADGLRASIGALNYRIVAESHAGGVLGGIARVPEAAIAEAMRMSWDRLKAQVEPSSAVPLAAIRGGGIKGLTGSTDGRDRPRVGIILTGGNVDLDDLPW
jgi:threonine dehydratase